MPWQYTVWPQHKRRSTEDERAERNTKSRGSILGVLLYRMLLQKCEKMTN